MPNPTAFTPDILIPILFLAFLVEGLVEYFARPFINPGPRAFLEDPPPDDSTEGSTELRRSLVAGDTPDADVGAGSPRPEDPPEKQPLALRYVAALTGVALCLAFRVDLLTLIGLNAWHPVIGQIITGLLIGRGSNYMHDLSDRWLVPRSPAGLAPTPKPSQWR